MIRLTKIKPEEIRNVIGILEKVFWKEMDTYVDTVEAKKICTYIIYCHMPIIQMNVLIRITESHYVKDVIMRSIENEHC